MYGIARQDTSGTVDMKMLPALNFEFLFSISAYKMTFYRRGVVKTPGGVG